MKFDRMMPHRTALESRGRLWNIWREDRIVFVFGTDWMCGKDNALARPLGRQLAGFINHLPASSKHFVSDGKGKGMSEEDFNESGGYPDLSLIGHSAMFSTVLR